jgi:glycosyltransferase involved in cell wall biosynthesis
MQRKPKVGILFRYGVVDHIELYPIIPDCLQELGKKADVYYIGPNRQKISSQHRYPGVKYVWVPFTVSRSSFREKVLKALLWYLWLPWLSLYCRLQRFDVIWIDESSLPAQAWIVQLLSGCPVAQTVTDFFVDIYKEQSRLLKLFSRLLDHLDRISWKRSAGIFTRTDELRNYLVDSGINCDVRTVRDAVLPDLFVPIDSFALRRKLGFSEDDVVICHHGILHPNKGIPWFIGQLGDFIPMHSELKILIVGDGPDAEAVRDVVRKHGMERQVVMTGWLANHVEVNKYLCAADIGLVMRLAAFHDHFHVTGACIHCMMAQLPILAANLRGVMEVVREGEEGFIFDPDDPATLRLQLEKMLESRERRLAMGERGRQKALLMFNPRQIASETADLLLSWAELRRNPIPHS